MGLGDEPGVRDPRTAYADQVVAHVPEVDLAPASITGIAGESGSGKSQTDLALMGLNGTAGARVTGSTTLDDVELEVVHVAVELELHHPDDQ